MIDIYNKVAKWNELRFKREYNEVDRFNLLLEEYAEWASSEDQVNDAKELLDIIIVALGGIWALDVDGGDEEHEAALEYVNHVIDQQVLMPGFTISALLQQSITVEMNPLLLMHCIIGLSLAQLQMCGLADSDAMKALNIVCNSNASKEIDGNLKPGKGANFVPAEPKLRQLMEKIGCLSKIH